jgi:hypothetical protein
MSQAEEEAPIAKQGFLHKAGGWMDMLWQSRAFALTSSTRNKGPTLLYADIVSEDDDMFAWNGCVSLTSASAAAATPGSVTDLTLSNVQYVHKSSKRNTIALRAQTQQARDEWIVAINAEAQRGKGVPGAAAAEPKNPKPK